VKAVISSVKSKLKMKDSEKRRNKWTKKDYRNGEEENETGKFFNLLVA
jgi:hypothetical protein